MNCKMCGKEIEGQYSHSKELKERQLCFHCDFWMEKVGWRKAEDPAAVVYKGWSYYIGSVGYSRGNDHWKGCGGQRWVVEFKDGRVVKTDNLWVQGDIPEPFLSMLPDNAVLREAGRDE